MEKYTYEELFTIALELGVEPLDLDEWIDKMIDENDVDMGLEEGGI